MRKVIRAAAFAFLVSTSSAGFGCVVPFFPLSTPQALVDRQARDVLAQSSVVAEGVVVKEAAPLYSGKAKEEGGIRVTKVLKGDVRVGDIIPISTSMCADGLPKGARGVVTVAREARTAAASFQWPVVVQSMERQIRENPSIAYPEPWREIATEEDEARMDNLMTSWVAVLRPRRLRSEARSIRHQIEALGSIASPGGAITPPKPAPARYRCRRLVLSTNMVSASPFYDCDLSLSADRRWTLTQLNGPGRLKGHLHARYDRQLVFLGTVSRGGSQSGSTSYGDDPARDVAGLFEHVGSGHYRIVMPARDGLQRIEILELSRLLPRGRAD
ncbi:MAG TPA: DUF4893 domain-containing protein [Allosphingosinicella sp.]|uniref:DUF4893 domain-containing protein n=1 Tax=Allosphingosinicella sp. TaxID=2823234 RepID=UPI002EDB3785